MAELNKRKDTFEGLSLEAERLKNKIQLTNDSILKALGRSPSSPGSNVGNFSRELPPNVNIPAPMPNLPMVKNQLPGPADIHNMATKISGDILPKAAADWFARVKKGVTQGPRDPLTGEYDSSLLTLGPETLLPGVGRALKGAGPELGAFAGSVGKSRNAVPLIDDNMKSTLRNLMDKYKDTQGKQKLIAKEFREIHPEYQGSDGHIQRVGSRINNWGGTNLDDGAKSSFELGAFGGRGKLTNTNITPAENMNWLQSQRPVDKQWVENWAKDSGVPIRNVREMGNDKTQYMELGTENLPKGDGPYPKVRIPTDENKHVAARIGMPEIGSLFDTGWGPLKQGAYNSRAEYVTTNKAGMSYSNPEAMDAALKWRTHKAPFGGNWLVPEEMAPRFPTKPTPEVVPQSPDPNQLKLLSQGYTPLDVLQILRQQNGQNQ